jgi:DNA-binding transcriptional ArsR family regulator
VVDGAPVPVDRFAWERALRRLTLSKDTRYVALVLATYADRDGSNAHPGQDVLAADCEVTDRTVRRHLARLLELGLIVRTFSGSTAGRRQLADVWQLTLPPDPARSIGLIPNHPALGR